MLKKFKIIVTGLIAQYPLGGVTWDYFQYVLGLRNLGHDVYYFEDTRQCPYNPGEGGLSKKCDFNVKYLSDLMTRYGMQNRWAYKFSWKEQWYGLLADDRKEVIETADLLINVSGSLMDLSAYQGVKKLVYIDSDPVFTQIKVARGQKDFKDFLDCHDVHFTFGENFSELIPDTGHHWIPTRQPVVLSEWQNKKSNRGVFTTIMNWTSHNDVEYKGETYGQKDTEFKKFIDLPSNVDTTQLEIAVNAGRTRRTPYDLLRHKGWKVVDPDDVCPDFDSYRDYIQTSKAEWSVAKNGYIKGQSGWFSCRSACYLAAGRPVILQDTGFSKVVPTGEGLFAFNTMEEAIEMIHEVNRDYEHNSLCARKIAENYFDSNKVLTELIENAYKYAKST